MKKLPVANPVIVMKYLLQTHYKREYYRDIADLTYNSVDDITRFASQLKIKNKTTEKCLTNDMESV